jgi:site-specific DNA recombinase
MHPQSTPTAIHPITTNGQQLRSAPIADLYHRLSTDPQEKGFSLDSQRAGTYRLAEQEGYQVGHCWEETDSGFDMERVQLQTMLARAQRHEIDAVIVYRMDRLARNALGRSWLRYELQKHGVKVLSVKDPIAEGFAGQIQESVMGIVDEMERTKINDRMTEGRKTAALHGRFPHGGAALLYGYDYIKEPDPASRSGFTGRRVINEREASVIREMFTLFDTGMALSAIARTLNERGVPTANNGAAWTGTVIRKMLQNEAYIGITRVFKYRSVAPATRRVARSKSKNLVPRPIEESIVLPEGMTPAIIERDVWEHAQRRLAANQIRTATNARHTYLFSGYIRCGRCGKAYVGTRSTAKDRAPKPRYQCTSASHGCSCGARTFSAYVIDELLWSEVVRLLETPDLLFAELAIRQEEGASSATARQLAWSQAEHAKATRGLERLVRLIAVAETDEATEVFQKEIATLQERIAALGEDIARLSDTMVRETVTEETIASVREYVARVRERTSTWTVAEKREALAALEISCVISPDGNEAVIRGRVPTRCATLPRSKANQTPPSVRTQDVSSG